MSVSALIEQSLHLETPTRSYLLRLSYCYIDRGVSGIVCVVASEKKPDDDASIKNMIGGAIFAKLEWSEDDWKQDTATIWSRAFTGVRR